jgi:hypothetical protein
LTFLRSAARWPVRRRRSGWYFRRVERLGEGLAEGFERFRFVLSSLGDWFVRLTFDGQERTALGGQFGCDLSALAQAGCRQCGGTITPLKANVAVGEITRPRRRERAAGKRSATASLSQNRYRYLTQ